MSKLNQQDRKDLEKFTKFLIYKSLQIIVQSRLGEKIQTKSKPFSSGADWFNLAIKDIPEVHVETKKALAGQTTLLSQNVCVEISLKTSEGTCMVLETWYIGLNKEVCDSNARISYTVYNRMSIALKTLLSISRVTPAYKLSRRQGACADDYVICYRMYQGDPQFFILGDNYHSVKVGSVPTPVGTIYINLAYRTKLLITPQKSSRGIPIELKDDHFKRDNSPMRQATTPKPCAQGYRRNSTPEDIVDGIEGLELCSTTFDNSPAEAACHGMVQNGQSSQQQKTTNKILEDDEKSKEQSKKQSKAQETTEEKPILPGWQIAAFVDGSHYEKLEKEQLLFQDDEHEPLFQRLMELSRQATAMQKGSGDSNQPESKPVTKTERSGDQKRQDTNDKVSAEKPCEGACSSPPESSSSTASPPTDFVMVPPMQPWNAPFYTPDPNTLEGFYALMQEAAQQTHLFETEPITFQQAFEELSREVDKYPEDEFDEFIKSLDTPPNEKNDETESPE